MIFHIVIILAVMLSLYFYVFNKWKNIEDSYFSTFKKAHNAAPWIICRTAYDSNTLKIIKNGLTDKCKQLNDWFYNLYHHALKYLIITSFNASSFPNSEYHLCFYVDTKNNYLHTAFDHHVIGGETITRVNLSYDWIQQVH